LHEHYPGVSYYYICNKLTKNEPDIARKSQILVDYIHQNVFVGPFKVEDLPPFANLIRGIGWCDQVSHLFIRLIEPLDIRGYLVFLNAEKDGTGSSPHSIAVITLKNKKILPYEEFIKEGVVIDILQGVIFKNSSGREAAFSDICARDVLDSQRKYFTENPSLSYDIYCNKGTPFLSNTPISLDNKKRRIFYKYIYPLLPEKAIYFYQDMVLNLFYKRYYKRELDFLYFKARNYHIYERFHEANKLYGIIIHKSTDVKIISECLFLQGMVFYRIKDFKSAKKSFEEIVKNYPNSPWVKLAQDWLDQS